MPLPTVEECADDILSALRQAAKENGGWWAEPSITEDEDGMPCMEWWNGDRKMTVDVYLTVSLRVHRGIEETAWREPDPSDAPAEAIAMWKRHLEKEETDERED